MTKIEVKGMKTEMEGVKVERKEVVIEEVSATWKACQTKRKKRLAFQCLFCGSFSQLFIPPFYFSLFLCSCFFPSAHLFLLLSVILIFSLFFLFFFSCFFFCFAFTGIFRRWVWQRRMRQTKATHSASDRNTRRIKQRIE